MVLIPLLLAILHIFFAGSTPNIFTPVFLKCEQFPTLLPTSSTVSFFVNENLFLHDFANSLK